MNPQLYHHLVTMSLQYLEELRLKQPDHFLELVDDKKQLHQINKTPDFHSVVNGGHKIVLVRNSAGLEVPVPFYDGRQLRCFSFDRVR